MTSEHQFRFPVFSRWLHWTMAALIIAMLFIGIGMAATVSRRYEWLVSIHRPLGTLILLLGVIRLVNRWVNPPPPLPASVAGLQRFAAAASHYFLYALMLALPLVGWAMLSAAPYPVTLWGGVHLPSILAPDPLVYARLRHLHTYLALSLYALIVLHVAAAMLHGLILRDGVFGSMASWRGNSRRSRP